MYTKEAINCFVSEMAVKAEANLGNKESEREIDNRNEGNKTGSNTDNSLDTELDTSVHAGHETPMTSGSSTPTDYANLTSMTAGNQDPSTVNLFPTVVDTAHPDAIKE